MSKGEKILKRVKTSDKVEIRLSQSFWKGEEWINLRVWTEYKGEIMPTRKGINMRKDIAKEFFDLEKLGLKDED